MPIRPPIEELLTMAPLPCSRIWRSSYFMQFQTPRRLIPFTRSNSSPLTSAISTAGDCIPALLNAASRRPKVDIVCATIAATSASSATLQRMPIALCPAATSSSAAERTAFSLTSASATAAPASAKALAVVRPMPEPAPVTSATLFSKDEFICVMWFDMIVGLRHGLAAVDNHGMSHNEGGRVGTKPEHGGSDLFRIPHPPDRLLRDDSRPSLRSAAAEPVHHWCLDDPGADRVDPDVRIGVVQRRNLGEADD